MEVKWNCIFLGNLTNYTFLPLETRSHKPFSLIALKSQVIYFYKILRPSTSYTSWANLQKEMLNF